MQTLAYNSNLHPAESIDELIDSFAAFSAPVREGLGWDRLGVDLRLGSQAIAECADAKRLDALRASVDKHQLSIHTINAFPLSPFQTEVVKDKAYDPDWTTASRLSDTIALIDIALALCDDELITISTLPCSFKPWAFNQQQLITCAQAFGKWAAAAAQRFHTTGRCVHLAIEPEPWCLIENTAETIAFWNDHLLTHGLAACASVLDNDQEAARSAIQRHLGICFDTCHVSLAYEDQAQAVTQLTAANIPIKKLQFSAALEVKNPHTDIEGLGALLAMDEPRFLHQSAIQTSNASIYKCVDLNQLQSALHHMPNAETVRSHFHIPVFWPKQQQGLSSTIEDSVAGLKSCVQAGCTHVAVETYTWSVLADDEQGAIKGTIQELEFLSEHI